MCDCALGLAQLALGVFELCARSEHAGLEICKDLCGAAAGYADLNAGSGDGVRYRNVRRRTERRFDAPGDGGAVSREASMYGSDGLIAPSSAKVRALPAGDVNIRYMSYAGMDAPTDATGMPADVMSGLYRRAQRERTRERTRRAPLTLSQYDAVEGDILHWDTLLNGLLLLRLLLDTVAVASSRGDGDERVVSGE